MNIGSSNDGFVPPGCFRQSTAFKNKFSQLLIVPKTNIWEEWNIAFYRRVFSHNFMKWPHTTCMMHCAWGSGETLQIPFKLPDTQILLSIVH